MKIKDLIAQIRANMEAKLTERNAKADELAALRDEATPDEAKISSVRAEKDAMDLELDAFKARISDLEEEEKRDNAADKLARDIVPAAGRPGYDRQGRVGDEKRTYRQDQDPVGKNFLLDVTRDHFGDRGSRERLERHMNEEKVERAGDGSIERATGTGAFAGLVVPQYLTNLVAEQAIALSPFADDGCSEMLLPDQGMSIVISRVTTGSSAALQASENATVSETDMDDTLLTIPVQTAAGSQTISRQAIERGTGIEDITLRDLFARVKTNLDSTLLNQASTGLSAVAQAVAYTDGTPTAVEMYPKILNANANIEAALLARGYATHVIMHSRRWNWLQSQVQSVWPSLAQPNIPVQAMGVNNGSPYNGGIRGVLPNGLVVIVDNNIVTNLGAGTNEDEIYVVPKAECLLWRDPNAPLFIRAEQPQAKKLGVDLVAYEYFAYTFSRYTNGTGKIGGTGLVTPTF